MSVFGIAGAFLFGLALICGMLSRRWPGLCWAACVLGLAAACVLLWDGADLAVLAAGAPVLALPLLFGGRSGAEQELP